MKQLLEHYGNHHCHCEKYIDLEHVLTLYILDLVVNVLGRDHVDPFLLRSKIFDGVVPLLGKYPDVEKEVVSWLENPERRSDECLHALRGLAETEVFELEDAPWS